MGNSPERATAETNTIAPLSRRVLVVDDNEDSARTFGMLLECIGQVVRVENSGLAALEAMVDFRPHVVLLDIGMPGMDGYTLARELRKHPSLQAATLVALTAYSSDSYIHRAGEAGFDYFLTKPADPGELERVFSMMAEALRLAQRTESLAQENVEIARQTKDLLREVRTELKYVKKELREVKEELRERQPNGE